MGPLVGLIIVIVVLIIGGIYFWLERLDKERQTPGGEVQNNLRSDILGREAETDDLASLEADAAILSGFSLDEELFELEKEL